jgi:hypothetical protein
MRWTGVLAEGSANRRPSASWASSLSVGARARANSSSGGNPGGTACRSSSRRSRRSCGGECISRFPGRGNGWRKSSGATSPIMACRQTCRLSERSAITSLVFGCVRFGAVARRTSSRGSVSKSSPTIGFRSRRSFIPGRTRALPSDTQGGSRMRETRSYGSVRGAASNNRPYREHSFSAGRLLSGVRFPRPKAVPMHLLADHATVARPPTCRRRICAHLQNCHLNRKKQHVRGGAKFVAPRACWSAPPNTLVPHPVES